MLADWLSSRRRRARRQAAADLAEWLDGIQHILQDCTLALAGQAPHDSGILLDAIDRALMRFNQSASEVQSPLRRADPELASRLRHCTDLAYSLRNHTRTYLLRAADVLALERHRGLPSPRAAHALHQAHQQAAEAAAALRGDLARLASDLQRLIAEWSETQ